MDCPGFLDNYNIHELRVAMGWHCGSERAICTAIYIVIFLLIIGAPYLCSGTCLGYDRVGPRCSDGEVPHALPVYGYR